MDTTNTTYAALAAAEVQMTAACELAQDKLEGAALAAAKLADMDVVIVGSLEDAVNCGWTAGQTARAEAAARKRAAKTAARCRAAAADAMAAAAALIAAAAALEDA